MNRAEKILDSLDGKETEWLNKVKSLDEILNKLVGNSLLYSAYVIYLATYDVQTRKKMSRMWLEKAHLVGLPISK